MFSSRSIAVFLCGKKMDTARIEMKRREALVVHRMTSLWLPLPKATICILDGAWEPFWHWKKNCEATFEIQNSEIKLIFTLISFPFNISDLLHSSGKIIRGIIISSLLQTEAANGCVKDYMEIRDGPTIASPVLKRSCGSQKKIQSVSSGNTMLLHLHTDGSNHYRGFFAIHSGNVSK